MVFNHSEHWLTTDSDNIRWHVTLFTNSVHSVWIRSKEFSNANIQCNFWNIIGETMIEKWLCSFHIYFTGKVGTLWCWCEERAAASEGWSWHSVLNGSAHYIHLFSGKLGLSDAAMKTGQFLHKAGPEFNSEWLCSLHTYFWGKLGLIDAAVKRGQFLQKVGLDIRFWMALLIPFHRNAWILWCGCEERAVASQGWAWYSILAEGVEN